MCEKLLKDFDLIPKNESKDSTFFEICGIDNELSTINNILAFFFDSRKGHNLQAICLNSLLGLMKVEGVKADAKVTCKKNVPTINNNTIDLLITSCDVAIIIETAIHPDLHNKFSQSFDCIETDKLKYGVVLSVFSILDARKEKDLPSSYDFITYGKLFEKIRKNIKEQDKNEYAMCLLNYMESRVETISEKEKEKEKKKIDQNFVDLLTRDDNATTILKLIRRVKYFETFLTEIFEKIYIPIIEKINKDYLDMGENGDSYWRGTKYKVEKEKETNKQEKEKETDQTKEKKEYKILFWNNDTKAVSLYRSRYVELSRDDMSYTIKVYIYLSYDGCYFEVLISKEGGFDKTVKKDLYTSLHSIEGIKWIKRDRCDFSFTSAPFCRLEEAEAKSEEIANKFCEIVETICKQDF